MPTETDKIKELENRLKQYEQDGVAKAAYAINRKLNELADMLNKTNVTNLDISDPKDKTFERLKVAWSEMASLGTAFKTLGDTAGITGDEAKDTQSPKYRITTPESMADAVGQK